MASRVASCLARLIEPDWENVVWYVHHDYPPGYVSVMARGWSWTGQMTAKDWHRLMQTAIGKLGRAPEVKVLTGEQVPA